MLISPSETDMRMLNMLNPIKKLKPENQDLPKNKNHPMKKAHKKKEMLKNFWMLNSPMCLLVKKLMTLSWDTKNKSWSFWKKLKKKKNHLTFNYQLWDNFSNMLNLFNKPTICWEVKNLQKMKNSSLKLLLPFTNTPFY